MLLPHDYLNFWLTGDKVMEYGDASGTALGNGSAAVPYSEPLTGLASGTTYYYCAIASNAADIIAVCETHVTEVGGQAAIIPSIAGWARMTGFFAPCETVTRIAASVWSAASAGGSTGRPRLCRSRSRPQQPLAAALCRHPGGSACLAAELVVEVSAVVRLVGRMPGPLSGSPGGEARMGS